MRRLRQKCPPAGSARHRLLVDGRGVPTAREAGRWLWVAGRGWEQQFGKADTPKAHAASRLTEAAVSVSLVLTTDGHPHLDPSILCDARPATILFSRADYFKSFVPLGTS